MSNDGYRVEYSGDGDQVCIIPNRSIPLQDFVGITRCYLTLGYKYWMPADDRGGYILSKERKDEPS